MTLTFQPTPPVLAPTTTGESFPVRRLFCIGRNYAAHAREMGKDPDREPPFFFTAWAETVVPDGGLIAYPQSTADYHHEIELVVAIGKAGRDVAEAQALDLVHGYAIGLDMTRRDLQLEAREAGRPWDAAKNVEQSKPLGPIHPAAGFDASSGAITLTVNGVTKQTGDLSDLIWSVPEVIAHLSRFYRLEPGDLIYTGTPAGVGPVASGDVLVGAIAGLGELTVTVGPRRREGGMILHSYFRSSAAWRVRIVLALKGVQTEIRFQHLRKGEHRSAAYLAVNPQGLLPSLVLDDGAVLTQSLAICEYLDERFPQPPLLPSDPVARARVRAFAQVIACDIHPVQNLKVLKALEALGHDPDQRDAWARDVISGGFDALAALVPDTHGLFAFGDRPTLADVLLVPQMANARRFGVALRWPRLEAIEAACLALPAFADTRPERQPDAE